MKRFFLGLLFVLLVGTACGPVPMPETIAYQHYLPLASTDPSPCRLGLKANLAWYAGAGTPGDWETFCFARYYHSGPSNGAPAPNQVPILWNGSQQNVEYARRLATGRWVGDVIVLNEPDQPQQANLSPAAAAAITASYAKMLPDATLLAPNIIFDDVTKLEWLNQYVFWLEQATGEFWYQTVDLGIHFYGQGGDVDDRIDLLCPWMEGFGIECSFTVTEFSPGFSVPERRFYGEMTRWLQQLERAPEVKSYYGYTIRSAQHAQHNWMVGDGITQMGMAWRDFHKNPRQRSFVQEPYP